jgi:hypothetical protein
VRKAPILYDGDPMVCGGVAIVSLCFSKFDGEGRLMSTRSQKEKIKVLEWGHAVEGMFMIHAFTILYTR